MMQGTGTVKLEVHPHEEGPWLVSSGGRRYAVPADIGKTLGPISGRQVEINELTMLLSEEMQGDGARWAASLAGGGVGRAGRPIWFRVPLLNARLTIKLSKRLSSFTQIRYLFFSTLLGASGLTLASTMPPPSLSISDPWAWVLAFALFLVSAVWHELGHAAALQREGYPPGGIGAGVLFVVPVLFADVTPMTALPRSGRLRVDIAGIGFQLGAGGIFAILAPWAGWAGPSLRLASLAALGAVTWSLLPFMRSDGYWLLCDLLGIPDLDSAPPATAPRRTTWLVGLFRAANALFMVAVAVLIPLRVHHFLTDWALHGGLDPDHPLVRIPALTAAAFLLVGVGLAAARRLRRLSLS